MKNIIVIAGPTGVGKTKLSVQLAKLIDAEIINADSMQVYKNLNIGTAKIKDDEKENIVHHLFDIVDINDIYTTGFGQGDVLCTLDSTTSSLFPLYWNVTLNGWSESANPRAPLSERTIKVGEAVYILKETLGSLTFSGKVESTEVHFGSESGNAWNQIVMVWPETKKINEVSWTGLAGDDQMSILNSDTSELKTYYWNDSLKGWSDSPNPRAPLSTDNIEIGRALYVHKVSAGIGVLTNK